MSHELSFVSGRAEVFAAGKTPWHKLGVVVPDRVTSAEAIKLAGLDWEVEQKRLYLRDDRATHDGLWHVELPDKVANIRRAPDGSAVYLGTVSKSYRPIQNAQAFGFIDAIVGKELAIIETAGALKEGRLVWILVKLPEDLVIQSPGGLDPVKCYLLVCNGHDGSMAYRMFYTPTRVVCWNTLNYALWGAGVQAGISIRHIGDIETRTEEVVKILGIANDQYQNLGLLFNHFAQFDFTEKDANEFFEKVFPLEEDKDPKHTGRDKILDQLRHNFVHGVGSELSKRTLWGAYNSVTEWADHNRFEARKTKNEESRFKAVMLAGQRDAKGRALSLARDISTAKSLTS